MNPLKESGYLLLQQWEHWAMQNDRHVLEMAVFFMVLGALLEHFAAILWRNFRLRRRMKKGAAAEKHAIRFLRQKGYQILDAQLQKNFTVEVNGERQKMTVRADYLVRKKGKTYVVEVKSGKQGDVALTHVRRQLLEYSMVYQPDGIILLDMAHHHLQEICFHYPHSRLVRRLFHLALTFVFCLIIAWIVMRMEIL